MKLAFCLFKYFPYGGLQRDFLRIARLCHERGHEVHVYTMQWQGEVEASFHLHLLKVNAISNHARCWTFAKRLKVELAKSSYDLVIGFNKMPHLDVYYAADVCYQARTNSKYGWLKRLLPRYWRLRALEHAVFAPHQQTDILLLSAKQQSEYVRYYQTQAKRFQVLSPGISKHRLPPANAEEIRAEVRRAHQLAEEDLVLLMVGSGFKTKGLDRAIRGLAALPATLQQRSYLWVVGQDRPSRFQQLAAQLGVQDRVKFLGGRADVGNFFLAADLLVHPAYHENTGTVLLEAIISGLPVLTNDVCGYAHYVEEAKAGIVLASPFQQAAYNLALEKMLSATRTVWQTNGLNFGKYADIYRLPEEVLAYIEAKAVR